MESVSHFKMTKRGVILKYLFTFKEQNVKHVSSLPTKNKYSRALFTRQCSSYRKMSKDDEIKL